MRPDSSEKPQTKQEVAATVPSEGRSESNLSGDAARLARLYRSAAKGELSESTKMVLKELLFQELGLGYQPAVDSSIPTISPVKTVAINVVPASNVATVTAKASAKAANATPSANLGAAQLELKLRQLIDQGAPWDVMEPLAIKLFGVQPGDSAAARVVELAFVHGTTERIEPLLVWAKKQAPGFYRYLHPTLRVHLVARLWHSGGGEALSTILFRERDESYLQPAERLYLFQSMATAADATVPYLYFKRFHTELAAAAKTMGQHVGLGYDTLLLRAGQLAIDLGYVVEAGQILEGIDAESPERDEALRLMLTATVEKNKAGRSHLVELMLAESSGEGRLALLEKFIRDSRGLGGFKDRSRPALNELLADPLSWLPSTTTIYSKLSEILVNNRDLASLLPNLVALFKKQALQFLPEQKDLAIWHGVLTMNPQSPLDHYWHGVGLLHFYVATGASAEVELWRSLASVTYAKQSAPEHLPFTWKELHRAAFNTVLKAPHLLDSERGRMLRQLRVAVPQEHLNKADLVEYAHDTEASPREVLNSLQGVAENLRDLGLARTLLLKRAAKSHLTNFDLNKIWQFALTANEHDLAWRSATILHARQALQPSVRHAWEFSGEKRSEYGIFAPNRSQIQACLVGFSAPVVRLVNACLTVGAALPELLALLDQGASVTKTAAAPHDSLEARIDVSIAKIDWLTVPKRRYRFSFESALGGTPLPSFMQVLPSNAWSLVVARVAERLGINAWGWRLSRLHGQIADLIPRLASRQDLRRQSAKVAAWLKDLTPEQRTAWQDMAALARALDDNTAVANLAAFVARVATVICPNHYMALTSLQSMRAPVAIMWDLETWLLSDSYSKLRLDMGTSTRVPVPNSLIKLTSIT